MLQPSYIVQIFRRKAKSHLQDDQLTDAGHNQGWHVKITKLISFLVVLTRFICGINKTKKAALGVALSSSSSCQILSPLTTNKHVLRKRGGIKFSPQVSH